MSKTNIVTLYNKNDEVPIINVQVATGYGAPKESYGICYLNHIPCDYVQLNFSNVCFIGFKNIDPTKTYIRGIMFDSVTNPRKAICVHESLLLPQLRAESVKTAGTHQKTEIILDRLKDIAATCNSKRIFLDNIVAGVISNVNYEVTLLDGTSILVAYRLRTRGVKEYKLYSKRIEEHYIKQHTHEKTQ
jgi:hypothetical protein